MIPTPPIELRPIFPELLLCGAAIIGMLYEAFAGRASRGVHLVIALVGIAAAAVSELALWDWSGSPYVLGDTVAVDKFSVVAGIVLLGAAALGCLFYSSYAHREPSAFRGEFFPLALFATAGMVLIAAANDLVVVFLALELLSLSLYVLTGITGTRRASEAAMKYFLLGAFSSAFFLYGVTMAYGAATSTKIVGVAGPGIVQVLAGRTGSQALALLAMGFLVIGFGFKISAAPFHMWTPDVYQGAPTPVVAFMSAATKVAAFFALIRVLDVAFQPLTWDWTPVIYALAVVSIVLGSVLAIAQRDVKRMLAYSSIAHAGFILTGLTAANTTGIRAAMFYLIVYSLMTVGAFGVVMLVSARGEEQTSLDAYAGLARGSPGLAALMTIFLLSLAGIPPTAGFIAKVTVFSAAIGAGNWPLAVVAVLASVVAAFFYLRVIVYMYMREPTGMIEPDAGLMPRFAAGALAAGVVVLGVFPGILTGILEPASVVRW
jgi:NADH-quinone oxidoreductase subunit N